MTFYVSLDDTPSLRHRYLTYDLDASQIPDNGKCDMHLSYCT